MINNYIIIIFLFALILIYLGWKLRKIYKKIVFFFLKRKGRLSEEKARKLLLRNNYKIIKTQYNSINYLYENSRKIQFSIRPDFLVEKEGITYVAEVKSGASSYIENISTRRQLLEYSFYNDYKTVLLVDTQNNIIKKITFVTSS